MEQGLASKPSSSTLDPRSLPPLIKDLLNSLDGSLCSLCLDASSVVCLAVLLKIDHLLGGEVG